MERFLVELQSLTKAVPDSDACVVVIDDDTDFRESLERLLRSAGLRARADYEYRLSLAGDQRGVFGRYPPVQPGWFPDPQNRCQIRYFDGAMWTPYAISR